MPWDIGDVDRHIKGLSDQQKRQWVAVANGALSQCREKGGSDCEGSAIRQANSAVQKVDWQREVLIAKVDPDRRLCFGWLSVSMDKDGNLIEDTQGDVIEPAELEKAGYQFVLDVRKAGEMHERTEGVGRLVESVILTVEKQEALGIPVGVVPVGWWVGFFVEDEEVWKRVKDGTYKAFSIGGKARREVIA